MTLIGSNLLSLSATEPIGWVASLHLQRAEAQRQLTAMYAAGQRAARIVLCFHGQAEPADPVLLNCAGGMFMPQQTRNLRDLLQMLLDIGFAEVELALMPQQSNSPWTWPADFSPDTHEPCQENWNLIAVELVPIVVSYETLGLVVRIDLNNEGVIGTDSPAFQRYRTWLWDAYSVWAKLPLAHTIGFSIQPSARAFQQMKDIYGPSGIWPQVHSAHIARGVRSEGWLSAADVFVATHQALSSYGYAGPVEIGETAPNEPEIYRELRLAEAQTGRPISKMCQWPEDWRLPGAGTQAQNCLTLEVPAEIPLD